MDVWGTRPEGSTERSGPPWTIKEFAFAVHGEDLQPGSAEKNVGNWRDDGAGPPRNRTTIQKIESALFGDNPDLHNWKSDLRIARDRSSAKGRKQVTSLAVDHSQHQTPPRPHCPQTTPYFTGRSDDVSALAGAVLGESGSAAVLVQGGPGIGKTELTKAIAHHADVAAYFGARRFFIRLENANSVTRMQEAIIVGMGLDPQLDYQVALEALSDSPTLLIFDNLETPWEIIDQRESVEHFLFVLGKIPELSIIASIRGTELVGGIRWHLWKVEPLLPNVAANLFATIAGNMELNDVYLDRFVAALGGIPLAIDLVARRASGCESLKPLWYEWNRIGADLAQRRHISIGRLTSLTYSIEIALGSPRMTDDAWRLFRLLGQLPAGLSESDLRTILGDCALTAREDLRYTGLGIERGDRIDLLPPIRDYADRFHPTDVEFSTLWAAHFINLADRWADSFDQSKEDIDKMRKEYPNIESAINFTADNSDLADMEGLLLKLLRYLPYDENNDINIGRIIERQNVDIGIHIALRYINIDNMDMARNYLETALAKSEKNNYRKQIEICKDLLSALSVYPTY